MSTVYNGNPANVTPTTTYSITEPADGDAANAASVNNPGPFQSLADIGAYIRLLGFGQTGFNPNSGLLPAAVGITGPTALNNYKLIASWIWAVGSPQNMRCYLRVNDGCLVFTSNCSPDGATNKWKADSTGDNAMAMFIGGTFFPGTPAAPNASPISGGFCIATRSTTTAEWVDKSPNQGGIGWESVIQWQGVPNTSGPGGGAIWQIGATQPGSNETKYTSIQANDLNGTIDVYASNVITFHCPQVTGLESGGYSTPVTYSGHLSDAVAVGDISCSPGPSSGGGAAPAPVTYSAGNVTLGTSPSWPASSAAVAGNQYTLSLFGGALKLQAVEFQVTAGSALTSGNTYWVSFTWPITFTSNFAAFCNVDTGNSVPTLSSVRLGRQIWFTAPVGGIVSVTFYALALGQ